MRSARPTRTHRPDPVGCGTGLLDRSGHRRQQIIRIEWLQDDVYGVERLRVHRRMILGSHQQYRRCGACAGKISSLATKLPAIHHGHVQVEHDQVGALFAKSLDCLPAVRRNDDMVPVRGQQRLGHLTYRWIIVHEQHERFDVGDSGRGRTDDDRRVIRSDDFRPSFGQEDAGDTGAEFVDFSDAELAKRQAVDGGGGL